MRRFWTQLAIATNWPVLAAVAVLSALGSISIWAYSRLTPDTLHRGEGTKQLVYLAVAFGCMVAFQAVDYRIIGRFAWPFYVFSLLLVLYTLLGGVADYLGHSLPFVHGTKGVYCWINLGPISLEPSELAKVAFVMVLARYLRFRSNYRTMGGLLKPFALALLPAALILKQPDLGVAALFVPTLLAMLFVAGAKVKHMVTVVGLGLAFVPIFWFSGQPGVPVMRHLPSLMKDYQRGRVRAMLIRDPAANLRSGYQQTQALTALGSGGWTGKGIGHIPVGETVPEAQNDMVFCLIGEQLGLLGAGIVLGAYCVLFAAGVEIASNTKEPFGRLVAVGIVAILATQTAINLMVCLRMMPVTGVTLPFVSYGGSSLLASYMAAGLLLNVGQSRSMSLAPQAFEFDDADD
jgi:cell division protein FtsW (lipid II flippase)